MRDFKNIKAFQFADELVLALYEVSKSFPREEVYGLTSQLKRAAVSIATNIAEGASRQHKRDYLNSLYTARGSLAETEYLFQLAWKLKYVDEIQFKKIDHLRQEVARTLFGLIHSVQKEIPLSNRTVFSLWSLVFSLLSRVFL